MNVLRISSKRARSVTWLVIFVIFLFGQPSIGKAFSPQSDGLIPLNKVIIQPNEYRYVSIPVNFGMESNATQEMDQWCGLDCVKRYWGGTNSLSVSMSRTASEETAQRAIENLREQFRGYGEAVYAEQGMDCKECGAPVLSWSIKRGKLSDDIVQLSSHGSVWIMMVLHVEGNPDNLFKDYCQGEQCWQSDLVGINFGLLELMREQHIKLGSNGYPPILEKRELFDTVTPEPTPVTPPPDALHRLDFLSYSPICELPCINGIQPGKSTVEEIPPFFKSLGMVLSEPLSSSGIRCMDLSGMPDGIYSPRHPTFCVAWEDSIVQSIRLDHWNHPELFQMTRIASVLGIPEDILAIYGHGVGPDYGLALHYPQKFLMIEIDGYSEKGFPWKVCLSDRRRQTTSITIYSQESERELMGRFFDSESPWYSWNEELGLDFQDLFDRMKQKNVCIPYFLQ